MKVCLVNPPLVTRGDLYYVPLGLSYLATVLREHGYEVIISDSQFQDRKDVLKQAATADVVGITSMTFNFFEALRMVSDIKRVNPATQIVMGGNHVTFTDVETLQNHPFVDVIVRNEGEATMVELLRAFSGGDLSEVKGITYREGDTIRRNQERPFMRNLDNFSFPALDLLDAQRYYTAGGIPHIISARGCPYRCMFCSTSSMWGHTIRLRSPKNVVDEIEHLLEKYKFKELNFADDTFTIVHSHVMEICEEIMKRGLEVEWGCNIRVDTLSEDLVQTMRKAGCNAFFVGVESGNQKTLDFMKKKTTISQIRKAVELAKKNSIKTALSCILGFPNETYSDVQNTIDFMVNLKGDSYLFNFLLVFPGTELYRRRKELNIMEIADNPWERLGKTPFPIPTVETGNLSLHQLCQLYLESAGKLQVVKEIKEVGI